MELPAQGNGPAGPLLLDSFRHLGHFGRRGAGTDGIREDMEPGETAAPQEGKGLGKLLLRLLREARNEVGGNGGMLKILV